jgi:hypothetical protein
MKMTERFDFLYVRGLKKVTALFLPHKKVGTKVFA